MNFFASALVLTLLAAATALAEPVKAPSGETLVSLHCKNESPTVVAKLLAEQSGVNLKTEPENLWTLAPAKNKLVTIDMEGRTFCEALQKLCVQTRTLPRADGENKGLILAPDYNVFLDRPACPAGPCLILAEGFNVTNALSFATRNAPTRNCSLNVTILTELGLPVVSSSRQLQITELLDMDGHVIVNRPPNELMGQGRSRMMGRYFRATSSINLDFAEALPSKFKTVKGTYAFALATAVVPIEINEVEKGSSKSDGDYTITVKDCKVGGGMCQFTIVGQISGPAKNDPRMVLLTDAIANARLYDDAGRACPAMSVTGYPIAGRYEAAAYFPFTHTEAKPSRVVIEIATATKNVMLPVEFHDLELP